MNILLWILQVLLALHTAMGAVWKFSNSEQATSLTALPHGLWVGLSVPELLCTLGLILPAFSKRLGRAAPLAASFLVAEMLLFTGVHLASGATENGPVVYWLVVAALCAFVAWGRFVLKPFSSP
jgi:hypothetical protein